MTNRVRERLYKKYPNIETALVDWHKGLWELVLESRLSPHPTAQEKEWDKWNRKNKELLTEYDDMLTYFLTYMNPIWTPILKKVLNPKQ